MKLLAFFCIITVASSNKVLNKNQEISTRIIGGRNVTIGEYSFMAAIDVRTATTKFFCGGTILTDQWILTAGQCVYQATNFVVKVGSASLTKEDSNRLMLSTSTYEIHPDYDPMTLANDVGLIKLHMPITFTEYIQPIRFMATFRLQDSASAVVLGWGQVSDEIAGESDHLQLVNLVTISKAECQLTYGNFITDNLVCVAGNNNEGICSGDAGNPLAQHVGRGLYIVVGIASFFSGNGCETADSSGFTRVFEYSQWIRNISGYDR